MQSNGIQRLFSHLFEKNTQARSYCPRTDVSILCIARLVRMLETGSSPGFVSLFSCPFPKELPFSGSCLKTQRHSGGTAADLHRYSLLSPQKRHLFPCLYEIFPLALIGSMSTYSDSMLHDSLLAGNSNCLCPILSI